jgi:hypothetical protein
MLSFPDSMTTMTGDGGGSIIDRISALSSSLATCPQTNRERSAIPEMTTSFAAFNAQVQHQGHTFTLLKQISPRPLDHLQPILYHNNQESATSNKGKQLTHRFSGFRASVKSRFFKHLLF